MALTSDNQALLSELYESQYYPALKKLFDEERQRRAKILVGLDATNVAVIAHTQGQASAYKQIHLQLKDINKKERKKEEKVNWGKLTVCPSSLGLVN